MYKIIMYSTSLSREIVMPNDTNLSYSEAIKRAEIYAKRNHNARFYIMSMARREVAS